MYRLQDKGSITATIILETIDNIIPFKKIYSGYYENITYMKTLNKPGFGYEKF